MEDRGMLGGLHPLVKLILLAMIMAASTLVVLVVGVLAGFPFFGSDLLQQLGSLSAESLNAQRYVQLLSHLGLFVLSSLVFAMLVGSKPLAYLSASHIPPVNWLLMSALIIFFAAPMVNFLVAVNQQLSLPESMSNIEEWMRSAEDAAETMTKLFLQVTTWQGLLFNLFLIAVIPAIGEEFIFRGALQRIFNQWTGNVHIAVIITAILFSAMHLQFFGFLPRLLLGIVLGYLFVYTGTIWVPVFAHFFNNAVAVIIFFLDHNGIINLDLEAMSAGWFAPWAALISLVVVALLFRLLQKQKTSHEVTSNY